MDTRQKKTKVGIIIAVSAAVTGLFFPDTMVDVALYIGIGLAAYGYVDKIEREMKWKRVDKRGHP